MQAKKNTGKGQFWACILHSRKNVYYRNRNALEHIYAANCIVIRKNEKNLGVISWKCVYLCKQLKIKDEVIGSYPEKNQRGPGPGPLAPKKAQFTQIQLEFNRIRGNILERDGRTCQKCGRWERLHVHHVQPLGGRTRRRACGKNHVNIR